MPQKNRVRLAISLSHIGGGWSKSHQGDLLQLATIADEAGVDQLVMSEHVALPAVVKGHPSTGGPESTQPTRFSFSPDEEYPDPLVALAGVAAVARRSRIATNILIAPLRPAVLLAKMVATLDVISGGRLDLGIGTGWNKDELAALGIPWSGVGQRLEDSVRACRALWAGGPSTYESDTVSFTDLYCSPTPIQTRIPLWFAGTATERTARRVVSLGDGWSPIGGTRLEDVRSGRAMIDRAAQELHRDPSDITIRCSIPAVHSSAGIDLGATLAQIPDWEDAGADVVQLPALSSLTKSIDGIPTVLKEAMEALPDRR